MGVVRHHHLAAVAAALLLLLLLAALLLVVVVVELSTSLPRPNLLQHGLAGAALLLVLLVLPQTSPSRLLLEHPPVTP